MSRAFFTAQTIITGDNAIREAGAKLQSFGARAFIVSGKTVSTLPCFFELTETLKSISVDYVLFNDITGEPDDEMISAGAEIYKESGCDFLIGLGGGSPIDAMKAIALISSLGGKLSHYMGIEIEGDLPKMAAIPTTAGTGSEATQFTVITDKATQVKMLLKGECLLPDLAIVDGKNTLSSPKSVTGSTALDALTHAVESYTSKKAQPLTDALSISAVKRIFKWLPIAYLDGNNLEARNELSIAALEAGICINNASVTLVHGMSRPIGALFHVPHGMSNAMLLSKCIKFACGGAHDRFARLACEIGISDTHISSEASALRFIDALCAICKACEVPTLEEYGVNREAFFKNMDKMAEDALVSKSPQNTIKEVTKEDIIKIYKSLWE